MQQPQLLSLNFSYWFLQTLAMLLTALLIPRLKITGPVPAFLTVVTLAFFNAKVWDAALFFHVPDALSTQCLALVLTNGLIFWIMIKLLPGIEVEGFLPAIAAPLVFTFCSLIISHFGKHIDWLAVLDQCINFLVALRDYFRATVPQR